MKDMICLMRNDGKRIIVNLDDITAIVEGVGGLCSFISGNGEKIETLSTMEDILSSFEMHNCEAIINTFCTGEVV